MDLLKQYRRLLGAMQSGVSFWMSFDLNETSPKHLRVGLNACMSDHGALVKMLIDKKVITEEEYYVYLCEFMKREVISYEVKLSERTGKQITLGALEE